jgi:predicted SAM-dependent methyltransferase
MLRRFVSTPAIKRIHYLELHLLLRSIQAAGKKHVEMLQGTLYMVSPVKRSAARMYRADSHAVSPWARDHPEMTEIEPSCNVLVMVVGRNVAEE